MAERSYSESGPNGESTVISIVPELKKNEATVTPMDNEEALNQFEEEEDISPAPKPKPKPKVRRKRKTKVKSRTKKTSVKAKAKSKPKPKAKVKVKVPTIPKLKLKSKTKLKAKMKRNLDSKRRNRVPETTEENAPTLQDQIKRKRPLSLSALKQRRSISQGISTPIEPVLVPKKKPPTSSPMEVVTPKVDSSKENFLPKNLPRKTVIPKPRGIKVEEISSIEEIKPYKGVNKSFSVEKDSMLFKSIVSKLSKDDEGSLEVLPITPDSRIHTFMKGVLDQWESLGESYQKYPRYHRSVESDENDITYYEVVYSSSMYVTTRGAYHVVLEVEIIPPIKLSLSEPVENKGKVTRILLVNPSLLT